MLRARFRVDIARPPLDVYRVISNHEYDPRWQSAVAEVVRLSAGPVRAGSRFRHTLSIMGARIQAELEVGQTRAAELHAFSAAGGPFAFDARVVLTATAAGTRMDTDIDGRVNGVARLAAIGLSRLRQREIAADHQRLKRLMEAFEL
jgi:carbon monoxide dehydrogenase subunit G